MLELDQHNPRPTRRQTEQDRRDRENMRAKMREAMMATGEVTNYRAVQMALKGYGIDYIHEHTGVDKRKLSRLVLGV